MRTDHLSPAKSSTVKRLLPLLLLPLFFVISMLSGPFPVSLVQLFRFLLGGEVELMLDSALSLRLYRTLLAAGAGAGLAFSGAVLQGLFRNPLIDSGLLGVNSGAGFGAALMILVGSAMTASLGSSPLLLAGNSFLIQFGALAGALTALLLCFLISGWFRDYTGLVLILAGVVVSSLFSSLLTLIKFTADPYDHLPQIIFWLMGSFSNASAGKALLVWGAVLLPFLLLMFNARKLDLVAQGAEAAISVGVSVKRLSIFAALAASVAAAAVVSSCGVIGWAGLIVPHLVRMLAGNETKRLLPLSLVLGADLLLMADALTRLFPGELPISIITSLFGVPFYIFLLRRIKGQRSDWNG